MTDPHVRLMRSHCALYEADPARRAEAARKMLGTALHLLAELEGSRAAGQAALDYLELFPGIQGPAFKSLRNASVR